MYIKFKKNLLIITLVIFSFSQLSAATFTVTNTNDSGAGSLRQAIINANASAGNDNIIFNLGAGGPFTITLLSALPNLTDNTGVTIDGWNNSGNNGTPNTVAVFSTSVGTPLNPVYKVILNNGASIPVGINVTSSNNLIRGLVLQNFGDGTPSNNDISISLSGNTNTVVGCYLGMDVTGTTAGSLTYIGVNVNGNANLIGDGTAAGVNLISGFWGYGYKIYISGGTGSTVKGNIIGLQADGTSMVTSTAQGIYLAANSNTIGGLNSGDGNLISGNWGTGIAVGSNSNIIQGNYIGPLSDGMSGLSGTNQSNGLSMWGQNNLLGGATAAARNIISGNTNLGMDMSGNNNRIQGNYWGPNKLGTGKLSISNNSGLAINTGTGNLIGGTNPGEGNLMTGVPGMAIWLLFNVAPATNTIQQNIIGLAAGGTSSLTGGGNGSGILMMLNSSNNLIGGSTASARNVISGSGTGISMSPNIGGGNMIKGNYIGLSANGVNNIPGPYQGTGIGIYSSSITTGVPNYIGGTGAGEGNVISGNSSYGIYLSGSTCSLNTIQQNTIGPQANGTSSLSGGTSQYGIYISNSPSNTIGGSTASSRNIISSNNFYGIFIDGSGSINNGITGNYIGPGSTGAAITGATQNTGIYIQNSANTNTIGGYLGSGGTTPQGNFIAFNSGDGINITSLGATSNLISRNLIYTNGGASKPIRLNYGGSQGNGGKAAPVIMTFTTSMVTGSNAATAGVGDSVEVYKNTTSNCRDLTVYVGTTLANAAGNWTLSGITINPGESVLATARTVANNNTSEVSNACLTALPIELLNFEALCDNNKKVNIKWATASEKNNDFFNVERSRDGENYSSIGKIKGAGNCAKTLEYEFADDFPSAGISYYRLKQTDIDGSFKYSDKVFVKDCFNKQSQIFVYPNPAKENIAVNYAGLNDELQNVEITDMFGKVVNVRFEKSAEERLIKINVENLSKGIYFLKLRTFSKEENIKFIKS